MGNTYTCDGCGKPNLDPMQVPKTLHWCQKQRVDGTYSANVLMCPECQTNFENGLKVKPEFRLKVQKYQNK